MHSLSNINSNLRSVSRRGNALVVTLAMVGLGIVAITLSTDVVQTRVADSLSGDYQERAATALTSVLMRQEAKLLNLVEDGDPERLVDFDLWADGANPGPTGTDALEQNYGETEFGGCVVRWKIEPCVVEFPLTAGTLDANADGVPDSKADGEAEYITNPSPDNVGPLVDQDKHITNEFTYVFRISGESRYLPSGDEDGDGDFWDEESLATVQSARYVTLERSPVFRFVIFYAQSGPTGDLELSHGDLVNIQGAVQSNGAIYLGGGTDANSAGALEHASSTLIGPRPDGPVRVVGVDGLFRLSKSLNYTYFSDWAYPSPPTELSGLPGSLPADLGYDTTSALPLSALDAQFGVNPASNGGTWVNPYRVTGTSNQVATWDGQPVTINGTNITVTNDSRTAGWSTDSLTSWSGFVRTAETGGRPFRLPTRLRDRSLEAQRLVYVDPRSEQHDLARPLFRDALGQGTPVPPARSGESVTIFSTTYAAETGEVELPGPMLGFAMGEEDRFMERVYSTAHIGGNATLHPSAWRIVDETGTAVTTNAGEVGLVIRERQVPYWDTTRWGAVPAVQPITAPGMTPYAYGKHLKPSVWPFSPMWISDQGTRSDRAVGDWEARTSSLVRVRDSRNAWVWNSGNAPWHFYEPGGVVRVFAGSETGDSQSGNTINGFRYSRDDLDGYYRSNWRFINLQRATGDTETQTDFSGTSDLYFDGSNFSRVRAKVRIANGGRTSDDPWTLERNRKVGLMIRPVDNDPSTSASVTINDGAGIGDNNIRGLNGRKPYAAMLFSPDRGFFSQRRLVASESQGSSIYYTATGDFLDSADLGQDEPGTRNVVASNDTQPLNDVIDRDQTKRSYTQNNILLDKFPATEGGEKTFKFAVGPAQYRHEYRRRLWYQLFFDLDLVETTYAGAFQESLDEGRRIRLYTGAWGGAELGNYTIDDVIDADTVRVRTGVDDETKWHTLYGPTVGSGTTVIRGLEKWNDAVTWAGSASALEGFLATEGYTVIDQPSYPTPLSDPATQVPYPSATPTPFTVPNTGTGVLFASERFARQEVNAYLSTKGSALSTAQPQWIPNPRTLDVSDVPVTYSYRPEHWSEVGGATDADNVPTSNVTTIQPDGAVSPRNWEDGRAYYVGALIKYNNYYYRCIQAHTSTTSNRMPNNSKAGNAFWVYVAGKAWRDQQIRVWEPGLTFSINDLVQANNRFFRCTTGHVSVLADEPVAGASAGSRWTEVTDYWVMIERDGNFLRFKYYLGDNPNPATSDFVEVVPQLGATDSTPTRLQIAGHSDASLNWSNNWLIGLAHQSGDDNDPMEAVYSDIEIELQDGTIIDEATWEGTNPGAPLDPNPMTLYLASQYQVFWGSLDITEYFFLWNQGDGSRRLAREEYMLQTREFWSQSRWWNEDGRDGITRKSGSNNQWVEKDRENVGNLSEQTASNNRNRTTQRERWARSTYLEINVAELQDFLETVTMDEATSSIFFATTAPTAGGGTLNDVFNGLFYVVRTNRYPFNPSSYEFDLDGDGTTDATSGVNPWCTSLPNTHSATGREDWRTYSSADFLSLHLSDPALNPYVQDTVEVPLAPPIRMEDFHHGVMWSNGSRIDWEYTGATDAFGNSKTSFVSPNAVYVRGDFNTDNLSVVDRGAAANKVTPVAVMGDSITLLSNAWDPLDYRQGRIWLNNNNRTPEGGILADEDGRPATSTQYRMALLTHNKPTDAKRTFNGESAAFVDTMLFMEDWGGQTMSFTGSLVVMDSRRYTRNYLLGSLKKVGRSPFGVLGFHGSEAYNSSEGNDWDDPGNSSSGIPTVYEPPLRVFQFNDDLVTEAGTPPFTPFGVTSTGTGGWVKIIK